MKFLLRSVLVLVIAAVLGAALYYVVQSLPGASPSPAPQVQRLPENGTNPPPGRARPENDRAETFRWRSLMDVARRVITFSVLVFAAILGKRFVFDRKPGRKQGKD